MDVELPKWEADLHHTLKTAARDPLLSRCPHSLLLFLSLLQFAFYRPMTCTIRIFCLGSTFQYFFRLFGRRHA
jgi:hypothetical protein